MTHAKIKAFRFGKLNKFLCFGMVWTHRLFEKDMAPGLEGGLWQFKVYIGRGQNVNAINCCLTMQLFQRCECVRDVPGGGKGLRSIQVRIPGGYKFDAVNQPNSTGMKICNVT